jgi:hypothetical protein
MESMRKLLVVLAALLALNAVLVGAQLGYALPTSFVAYLFGPKMVRGEIVVKDGGAVHDYRIDQGRIRAVGVGNSVLTLYERDGQLVTVAIAPGARITLGGHVVPLASLKRGMRAITIRDGKAAAETVQAFKR